jgi:hypothetical protein
MTAHEHRQHATWAASSTARHLHCPGSLALSLSLPRGARVEREAAAWGTCCHQIAEMCLNSSRFGLDAANFIGEHQSSGKYTFVIDDDMANCAQVYVDYCRSLIARGAQYWIEENLSLAKLDPPFDSGGTGDFIAYLPKEKLLEIVDLKGGRGVVVDAAENAQTRSYALGAMLAHPGLGAERVKTTIVQPRADHKDGVIRSETFHVVDLMEWAGDLLEGMNLSAEALDAFAAAQGNSVLLDEWRDVYLRPGKCQFCPAEGVCPALRNDARSVIDKWFETDPDTGEITANAVLDTSPEALAADLDLMDQLTNWMNARRAYAQQFVESGGTVPGYQLVDKRGTRKWVSDNEGDMAFEIGKAVNIDISKLYSRKLLSPAQVEKLIPAVAKKNLTPLWHMHVSGTNLVRSDKTNRPAVGNLVDRFFEPSEQEK